LRDGGSADERSQKKREKKPFHGHTPKVGRTKKCNTSTQPPALEPSVKTIYRKGHDGSQKRNQKERLKSYFFASFATFAVEPDWLNAEC
jgi:hypothetical protein